MTNIDKYINTMNTILNNDTEFMCFIPTNETSREFRRISIKRVAKFNNGMELDLKTISTNCLPNGEITYSYKDFKEEWGKIRGFKGYILKKNRNGTFPLTPYLKNLLHIH